jgi:hypothetical protein
MGQSALSSTASGRCAVTRSSIAQLHSSSRSTRTFNSVARAERNRGGVGFQDFGRRIAPMRMVPGQRDRAFHGQ